jgi:hypothetical protein
MRPRAETRCGRELGGVILDGQPSLWEQAAQTLGEAPRVKILDLLPATRPLGEAVYLFHAPGSAGALKRMELGVWALLAGMSEGVVSWGRRQRGR